MCMRYARNVDKLLFACYQGNYHLCDFETGICDWLQLTNDELDWRTYRGITPTEWTGPTRDHTTGLASGKDIQINIRVRDVRLFYSNNKPQRKVTW